MRKTAALLIALFLLLAGCGQPTAQPTAQVTATPTAQVTPTPTAEPTPAPTAEPARQLTFLDRREPVGELGNLWYVPCDTAETILYPEMQPFGETGLLLVSCDGDENGYEEVLKLISLEDGSLLAEAVFPSSGYVTVRTGDRAVGLCDSGSGAVHILDENLATVRTYELEGPDEDWYLSRDMKTLYRFCYDRGLVARDLGSGAETVLLDHAARVYAFGMPNRYVLFTYVDLATDRTYCKCLDLDTGVLEDPPTADAVDTGSRVGNRWLLSDAARWGDYMIFAEDGAIQASWDGSALILLEPQGLLLAADGTGRELFLYEPDGSCLSRCSLPQGENCWVGRDFVWSDLWSGYFFLDYGDEGVGRLMLWDPRAETSGAPLPLKENEVTIPTGIPADYERAAELSRRFGVDIRIASQCALDYNGYTAYAIGDWAPVSEALDTLERALSVYPEGFLQQLHFNWIRDIRIELVGGLSPKEDAPESISAAAFTQDRTNYYLMVADVYLLNEAAVFHELSHIIDSRLEWNSLLREDALFSEEAWFALQPAGFQYAWSYRDIPDSTAQYYGSEYFISDYSCTFPTEDRATLLEAAMCGDAIPFAGSPALCAKLDYYSRCIRDCLDTSGWPSTTVWEDMLIP